MRVASFLWLSFVLACGDDATAPNDAAPPDTGPDAPADTAPADTATDTDGGDAATDAGVLLPSLLSETGLYVSGTTLATDVLEYDVRFPLWTDGLNKRRFIFVPAGSSIDTSDPDEWVFPVGTKLWKEFSLDGVRLETRLFQKAGPDAWGYVSYVWRADGSDAEAAPEGVVDVLGTFHDVPETSQCFGCHRGVADIGLGVSAFQLTRAGFMDLQSAGILSADAPMADPPGRGVEPDALGALHANCGHCHSDLHPLAMSRALRLRLRVDDTLETTGFYTTAIGAMAAHVLEGTDQIVVPGDPDTSQLYWRPNRRDELQMPPFGTERVNTEFVALIGRFISSL